MQKLHFGRGHQLFGNMKLFIGCAPEAETWHEPWHNIRLQDEIVHRQIERRISCEKSIRRCQKNTSAAHKTMPSSPQDRYYSTANRSTSQVRRGEVNGGFLRIGFRYRSIKSELKYGVLIMQKLSIQKILWPGVWLS